MGNPREDTERELSHNQMWLMLLACVSVVLLSVFIGIVVFAQPVHIDVVIPSVVRFKNYGWYKVVPFAVLPVTLFLLSLAMAFPRSKIVRVAAGLFILATVLWFFGLVINDAIQTGNRNDPNDPLNPANSYYACCTPQFFTAVASCPNFGNPSPQCFPPRTLQDIGSNGDNIMVLVIEVVYIALLGVSGMLLIQMHFLIKKLEPGPDSALSESSGGGKNAPLIPNNRQMKFF